MRRKEKRKKVPLAKTKEFQQFRGWLEEAKRVLISTHEHPDGDGLGAETALFHYLKRARKSCRVYNPDRVPTRYKFLDPKETVLMGPGQAEVWDRFDLWVIVDTNDPRRLGPLWKELQLRAKRIVFLDHHTNLLGFKDEIQLPKHAMTVSDCDSSSIGELLHHLFGELDLVKSNREISQGLYVSVMTDTNSFRYSRTTPLAHRIAADTIEDGVNPEHIYQQIYSSKELSHLQLLGFMLQNVQVGAGGKLAWLEMDLELRKKHRASSDDTQSFMNLLLLLKDAEIVAFFREEEDNRVRVSIKSKGRIVINKLAMELGGGGHEFAAGAALKGPLEKAVQSTTIKLEEQIESYERFGK